MTQITAPNVSGYVRESAARAASQPSETEARAQRSGDNVVTMPGTDKVVRLAAQLNALILKADASLAEKVGTARNRYASLLRGLPWDFQVERREHEFVVFCEELFGADAGEAVAWEIICRGGIT